MQFLIQSHATHLRASSSSSSVTCVSRSWSLPWCEILPTVLLAGSGNDIPARRSPCSGGVLLHLLLVTQLQVH